VNKNRLTGIVLAGGKSSRMGADKGLMDFHGRKLIEYPLSLLRLYTEALIISANNTDYGQFGVQVIPDKVSESGPLSGVAEALKYSSTEWNIVLPCDMPFINQDLIDILLKSTVGFLGAVPVHSKYLEPLCAVYHKGMLPVFEDALSRNELSLHAIIRTAGLYLVSVDDLLRVHPFMFSNFNSPEDMKAIQGYS